jgi:hypothetical protein
MFGVSSSTGELKPSGRRAPAAVSIPISYLTFLAAARSVFFRRSGLGRFGPLLVCIPLNGTEAERAFGEALGKCWKC